MTETAPNQQSEVTPATRAEWRAWLADNHDTAERAWVVTSKQHVDGDALKYEDAVREALCQGWIDGTVRTRDDDTFVQMYTPRRPGSNWASSNKRRVDELVTDGLMQPAGQAAIDRAHDDGSWEFLDDIEACIVPEDLGERLATSGAAQQTWESFTTSQQRAALYWIKQAKRDATRRKRIDAIADAAARGEFGGPR